MSSLGPEQEPAEVDASGDQDAITQIRRTTNPDQLARFTRRSASIAWTLLIWVVVVDPYTPRGVLGLIGLAAIGALVSFGLQTPDRRRLSRMSAIWAAGAFVVVAELTFFHEIIHLVLRLEGL